MNTPNNPTPTIVEALKAAKERAVSTLANLRQEIANDPEGRYRAKAHYGPYVAQTDEMLTILNAALLRAEGERTYTQADVDSLLRAAFPAQPHHPTASVEAVARDALRRARDFIQDEVNGRIEAGGEETDYAKEAQDVLAVVDAALTASRGSE